MYKQIVGEEYLLLFKITPILLGSNHKALESIRIPHLVLNMENISSIGWVRSYGGT
jgi:hypothetical protein